MDGKYLSERINPTTLKLRKKRKEEPELEIVVIIETFAAFIANAFLPMLLFHMLVELGTALENLAASINIA